VIELESILRCPLTLRELVKTDYGYYSPHAEKKFVFCKGMYFFGRWAKYSTELEKENNAELRWQDETNTLIDHINFASWSLPKSNEIILTLKQFQKIRNNYGKVVLDIGAGAGQQSYQFCKHGFFPVAVELSKEILASGEPFVGGGHSFLRIVNDCYRLPFADKSFDIIFAKELVHHLHEPTEFYLEMNRVLKDDGIMVVTEPCIPKWRKTQAERNDIAREIGINHHYISLKEYKKEISRMFHIVRSYSYIRPISAKSYPFVSRIQGMIVDFSEKAKRIGALWSSFQTNFIGGGNMVIFAEKREPPHDLPIPSRDRFTKEVNTSFSDIDLRKIGKLKELNLSLIKIIDAAYENRH
jgi:SAM-dependent methyltransferase